MCRKSARVPIYPSRINCAFQVQEGAVQLCLVLLSVKMDFVLYLLHHDKFYPISSSVTSRSQKCSRYFNIVINHSENDKMVF